MQAFTFKSFIHCLDLTVDGFSSLKNDQKEIISSCILTRALSKHKQEVGKFVILKNDKIEFFRTQPRFDRFNQKLNLFIGDGSWSNAQGIAQAWSYSDQVKSALSIWMNFIAQKQQNEEVISASLINKIKKIVGTSKDVVSVGSRKLKTSLASTDINGNKPVSSHIKDYFPDVNVVINTDSLGQFINETETASLEQIAALYLYAIASTNNGIPTQYTEYSNGRLFCRGVSLQNVHKSVRKACFAGSWSYDIQNCHVVIMLQKCLSIDPNMDLNEIKAYVQDKTAYRTMLAEVTGLDISSVKKAMLALIFGAQPNPTNRTMLDIAGSRESSDLLVDAIKPIAKDIAVCRKVLIKHYESIKGRARGIVNDSGKTLLDPKASDNEKLAFILQGTESAMLRVMITCYGKSLSLLIHDGVIANKRLDVSIAEKAVYDALGIKINIDEEYIGQLDMEHRLAA